jgi:hypothetical protein
MCQSPVYRVRSHTGPGLVSTVADAMRSAGIEGVEEGTENVYCVIQGRGPEYAAWNVLAALFRKHRTDYGLRPIAHATNERDVHAVA